MTSRILWVALSASTLALSVSATAHEIVGNRMFPATLAIDDPGVADELAFPTITTMKNGDTPSARETGVSAEYSKLITEDFAIAIAPSWVHVGAPGGPSGAGAYGFDNIETSAKYRLYKNAKHEFVLSIGVEAEWGGTGARSVADPFNTFTPTVYFGKGLGDLPDNMALLRPLAVTGVVGYSIPSESVTDGEANPRTLEWGFSVQYSMPYLKSAVKDYGFPDLANRLIPIVELAMETPVSNTLDSGTVTTGTINPGILYVGDSYQFGIEAMFPVNRASGTGVGVIAQLHLFLDDIFPNTIGRPLFTTDIASR
jgi:hypothetical protein